ncbi:hypothetical protein Tsubulata_046568 [Turnera subulata]|uniref:PAZ domain-containing protein n=1 Tax=Turnera subulata TaxID=218843 RepID=A0A9Q0G6F6_9ROSI|nr:hypothetical protein Tsubulata_046568 [Turnera subulata]
MTAQNSHFVWFCLDDMKTEMSVLQHFQDKYNIVLKYPSVNALQAGSDTKPVYLSMELCTIVEKQRYSKRLNEKQVTNLLNATCRRPTKREGTIKRICETKLGIASQCCQPRQAMKLGKQYQENVALKINSKAKGAIYYCVSNTGILRAIFAAEALITGDEAVNYPTPEVSTSKAMDKDQPSKGADNATVVLQNEGCSVLEINFASYLVNAIGKSLYMFHENVALLRPEAVDDLCIDVHFSKELL